MATPEDSLAPVTPTLSSPITGKNPLWSWFKNIGDWIRALSPAGSTVYDTGWVPLELYPGFVGGAPAVRRIGKMVIAQGSTVAGSFPNGQSVINLADIPDGFIPARSYRAGCYLTAGRVGLVGVGSAGVLFVRNETGLDRDSLQFSLVWFVD